MKGWNQALGMSKNSDNQWALYAKACLDRTRLALVTKGEEYHQTLQPSAEYLGSLLGVEQWTVSTS
jgi:alpha-glucan, water dikinase